MLPPPLTAAELAALYDAEPTPTVRRLLYEIARLRARVQRAHQIRTLIGPQHYGVTDAVWMAFENELNGEPCLPDPMTPRQIARVQK